MEITYFLAFNRLVSKSFYRIQTRMVAAEDVVFLNIGYEDDPPMAVPLEDPTSPTGSPFSSTTAPRPRPTSAANRCWRSAAATAAEPRTSCAPCARPPTRGWT